MAGDIKVLHVHLTKLSRLCEGKQLGRHRHAGQDMIAKGWRLCEVNIPTTALLEIETNVQTLDAYSCGGLSGNLPRGGTDDATGEIGRLQAEGVRKATRYI